jgi:hypothetical protein
LPPAGLVRLYATGNQINLYVKTDNVKQKTEIPTKKFVFREGDFGGKKGLVNNKGYGIR